MTHPLIARVASEVDHSCDTPNEFHGIDFLTEDGCLRLAAEGDDPAEGISVYRFDRSLVLLWSARFDANAPTASLTHLVLEGLK